MKVIKKIIWLILILILFIDVYMRINHIDGGVMSFADRNVWTKYLFGIFIFFVIIIYYIPGDLKTYYEIFKKDQQRKRTWEALTKEEKRKINKQQLNYLKQNWKSFLPSLIIFIGVLVYLYIKR